ncbi:response regulator, partial [Sphaerisporangium rhizosphaerae]
MIKKEKFETFDALRFFSFLLVFIFHLPPDLRPLETRGDIGVWFFFSLSGFLITYLLLIEKKNYTVKTCNNGRDAVDLIQEENFDIVFLDENMPGMSGLETLSEIKEKISTVPVIMITKSKEEYI